MSNFIAQSKALMLGKDIGSVIKELNSNNIESVEIDKISPFKVFDGNKPSNSILIDKLNPYNLGALISMYEHKIFVQGIIWNIYSFDQWGVELGKKLADEIFKDFYSKSKKHDISTENLITKLK